MNVKISEMPSATSLDGTELVQGGTTKQATVEMVKKQHMKMLRHNLVLPQHLT